MDKTKYQNQTLYIAITKGDLELTSMRKQINSTKTPEHLKILGTLKNTPFNPTKNLSDVK